MPKLIFNPILEPGTAQRHTVPGGKTDLRKHFIIQRFSYPFTVSSGTLLRGVAQVKVHVVIDDE